MLAQHCHPGNRSVRCFHVQQCSRKLGRQGVWVDSRGLRADIQKKKKGKSAPLDLQTGGFWAQNSSQEVYVCKNSTMRFSSTASLASVTSLLNSYFKHELVL